MYFIDIIFFKKMHIFSIGFVSSILCNAQTDENFVQNDIWTVQINKYYYYTIINLTQKFVAGFDCVGRRSVTSQYYGSKISGSQQ